MFRLINLIIEIQINALKFKKFEGKNILFYYRDILNILEHPYIRMVLKEMNNDDIAGLIQKTNKVFIGFDEILTDYCSGHEQLKSFCSALFQP